MGVKKNAEQVKEFRILLASVINRAKKAKGRVDLSDQEMAAIEGMMYAKIEFPMLMDDIDDDKPDSEGG